MKDLISYTLTRIDPMLHAFALDGYDATIEHFKRQLEIIHDDYFQTEKRGRVQPEVMPENYGQMLSGVDEEIRDLVDVLNKNNYETVASCSGHGKLMGNIALKDGRELFIIENYDKARLATKLLIEAGLYSRLNE